MKRLVIVIVSILLVGAFMTPSVAAQTSDNLEWSIQVDDQFFMHYYIWDSLGGVSFDEDIYMNSTGVPGAIPDPLTDMLAIPIAPLEGYDLNGTMMGMETMYLLFVWKPVLPVGNWSLMTTLCEDVTDVNLLGTIFPVTPHVYIDNWYSWGFSYNATAVGEGTYVVNVTYSKADGFFSYYSLKAFEIGTEALVAVVELYRDGNPPVVESPDDIEYSTGDAGHSITWTATDQSPAGYQILKDDVDIKHGLWNSTDEDIQVSVDGLSAGSYNYTVVFYEASGISTSDQVQVDVIEPVDPTIDHPANVTYVVGETGNLVTWNPSDDSPASYQILKNGIEARSGLWNSSTETISISVDGLTLGSYNYTIIVTDDDANTAVDTVWVEVTATPTTGIPVETLMLAVGVGGVVIILIAIVVIKKR